jgi:hypothetical protein
MSRSVESARLTSIAELDANPGPLSGHKVAVVFRLRYPPLGQLTTARSNVLLQGEYP